MEIKSHWLEPYTEADSLQILEDLSLPHAYKAGGASQELVSRIKARDYSWLCNCDLDVRGTWESTQLFHAVQALAFYRKNPTLKIGVNRKKVAYDKFTASEKQCAITNDIFFRHMSGGLSFLPADCRILYAVRRKVCGVLGVCPSISDVGVRFGPGATTLTKKKDSCPSTKMAHGLACSQNLYRSGLLPSILRTVPHWTSAFSTSTYVDEEGFETDSVPVILTEGKLGFVPKNAKTDRATVTEPTLNMFFQLGYGDVIANRLRKQGIDIRRQEPNQGFALTGSLTNEIATLDLSSASDLVSRGLVKFLLPDDWYFMLNSLRSACVEYRKRPIQLEKFSSMGNGFTFPLETLIFWAITSVVCDGDKPVSAYGDDIICPSKRAADVIRVLNLCGFSVNSEKSFWDGPFRESCGHDYYLGFDTRPCFLDEEVTAKSLFTLHNFYVRKNLPDYAARVRGLIHPDLKLYGPDGYGDGHLIGDHPRCTPPKLEKKGFSGYKFDTWSLKTRRRFPRYPGDYISPLYHIYTRGEFFIDPLLGINPIDKPVGVQFSKNGYPLWPLPGGDIVRRLSIYTLG